MNLSKPGIHNKLIFSHSPVKSVEKPTSQKQPCDGMCVHTKMASCSSVTSKFTTATGVYRFCTRKKYI